MANNCIPYGIRTHNGKLTIRTKLTDNPQNKKSHVSYVGSNCFVKECWKTNSDFAPVSGEVVRTFLDKLTDPVKAYIISRQNRAR